MSKQTSIPGMEEHDLGQQALSLLKATKYKEAIRLYKKLLLTSDADEWRKKLAYCYLQRAIDFAAKGMYKEALVLWENHVEYVQAPYDAYDQYIIWLVQTNNQANIQSCLKQLSAQQLDRQYPALAAVLGQLMLSKHPEFEQCIAQDSMLVAHFKVVQAALQAYQDNDSEKLITTLKLLPYRSAYKDFRIILNAMIVMPGSIEQAQSHLAKIPENSAYVQTARILLACTKDGSELIYELTQLSHQQRNVIAGIKGMNKKQRAFIEHFCRIHENLSDKVQFNIAIQYQELLGTSMAQVFCQAILANYSAGKKDFYKHFGEASEFEENRVKALRCEQDNNLYDAEYYWRQCLKSLDDKQPENNLKAALILRHMAERESEWGARTELLEESLDFDAEDRNSYLQIIRYYGQQADAAKSYKTWLARTLEQFPQDVDVLIQAVKAATANKTYKKASQYATRILKIDPLNTFAKQTLFSSYLDHARRLMREKNFPLVEKEINRAEKLNFGKAYLKQTLLMRALLCFAYKDKQQGLQDIAKTLSSLHTDPVNGHFQATMEALLNGLPVATILRELPPVQEHLLTTLELSGLIQQLNLYAADSDNWEYLYKALDKIKAPLKKSLSGQDYSEDLLLSLCQVLDGFAHFELLRHCARLAQLKWKNPVWLYYRVYADNNGKAEDCSYWDVQRLQNANDQAREEKDYPTAMLIDKFLDSYFEIYPERNMGFLEGLFGDSAGDSDEINDPLDELFGHLPDHVMIDLNTKAESLLKKMTPEKLAQEIELQVDGDQSLLMAMMLNAEVFSALMLLKAADELFIDIDTNIHDVIEVFGISENKNSFPFPL